MIDPTRPDAERDRLLARLDELRTQMKPHRDAPLAGGRPESPPPDETPKPPPPSHDPGASPEIRPSDEPPTEPPGPPKVPDPSGPDADPGEPDRGRRRASGAFALPLASVLLGLTLAACGEDYPSDEASTAGSIEAILLRLEEAPADYLSKEGHVFLNTMRQRIESLQELLDQLEEELDVDLDEDQQALVEMHDRLLDSIERDPNVADPSLRADAVDLARRIHGEAETLWNER